MRAWRTTTLRLFIFFAVSALAIAHGSAHGDGRLSVQASGGIGVPVGSLASGGKLLAKPGVSFGGAVEYSFSKQIVVGVDGSFSSLKEGCDSTSGPCLTNARVSRFKINQVGAHFKYRFPMADESRVMPHLFFGGGRYGTEQQDADGLPIRSAHIGGNLGLGLGYRASDRADIGIDGAFNAIRQAPGQPLLQFISVRFFAQFSTAPP